MSASFERVKTRAGMFGGSFLSNVGIASSVLYAAFAYVVLWDNAIFRYVPNLSTPLSALNEAGTLGIISLVYIGIQFSAMATRNPGRIWNELGDLIFSILPVFVIVIALINQGWSGLTPFQGWAIAILGMATIIDVIVVTLIVYRLLLMANDMFVSN